MKRIVLIILVILSTVLSGCKNKEETDVDYVAFQGTVNHITEHALTIDVTEGDILDAVDCVTASFPDAITIEVAVGDTVQIWYDGEVMETYPAQVNAVSYEIIQAAQTDEDGDEISDENSPKTNMNISNIVELSANTPVSCDLSATTHQILVNASDIGGNVDISFRKESRRILYTAGSIEDFNPNCHRGTGR